MMDMDQVAEFAELHGLWVVEDAAHALPASYRSNIDKTWRICGQNTAHVTCYSFYANKTITTGEGGMAVTNNEDLAEHMRRMSLHGLSRDGWNRHQRDGQWDYRIIAAGYKYNLTDISAAVGIHQLARAEEMRLEREAISVAYHRDLCHLEELELPPRPLDRIHSWHLYPIRLNLDRLEIDRNAFVEAMREYGIGFSVHWRPLHLHPYYLDNFSWPENELVVATAEWQRLISLPIFPGMLEEERQHVVQGLSELCSRYASRAERHLPIKPR
jgi:perosamine synthetase